MINLFTVPFNSFFACTPLPYLFWPLVSIVLMCWSVVVLINYSDDKKLHLGALVWSFITIFFLVAVPIFGMPGMAFVLYFYFLMLQSLQKTLEEITGKISIVVYLIGFAIPLALIWFYANYPFIMLFSMIIVLKLAVALAGLFFLKTFIRKVDVEPAIRKAKLKLQGSVLFIMIFLLVLLKIGVVFRGSLSIYLANLTSRLDTYAVVFTVLFGGALFYILQERRLRKIMQDIG